MKRTHKFLALLLSLALAVTICAPGMLAADAEPGPDPAPAADSVPAAEPPAAPELPAESDPAQVPPAADPAAAPEAAPAADSEADPAAEPTADPEAQPEAAQPDAASSDADPAPEEPLVGAAPAPDADGADSQPEADELEEPDAEAAQPTLYEKLMAIEDDAAFADALAAVTEEEAAELTEEETAALEERLSAWEDAQPRTEPQTVNVTDPGPFMPAVSVALQRVMMSTFGLPADDGPLHLAKSAAANEDGSYTITMEAYTTGTVTTTEKVTPVDIVLVLDQSGSMDYNFAGDKKGSGERQNAMKSAVSNFIDSVSAKYSAQADHRIALVEFRSDAKILKNWTDADAKGAKSLKGIVNGLNAEGATNVGAGMQKAEQLMGRDYNYSGSNSERQKVVIVFTDGVPTTSSEFHTGVANTAIKSAKNLKDSGVTVYSVGIFTGADPAQTYGDKGFKQNSDGSVGSKWYDGKSFFGGLGAVDIPAGNRFLNYMSSNYANATEIGLKGYSKSAGLFDKNVGWEITKKFDRTAPADQHYYLSANNSADLNKIFQQISEQIATPGMSLGSEAVIKDIITPYFTVPNAQNVKVYTAAFNGTSFGARQPSSLTAAITGDTVAVTGFDFDKNFVSTTAKADGSFGSKLIIEVTVWPKDGFLGGNGVPTNKPGSGLYDKDGDPVGSFEEPKVDVPVKPITITVPDGYVYLNGTVANAKLRSLIEIKADGVRLDLVKGKAGSYGLEPWQAEFVSVSTPDDPDRFINIKEDMTYTVNASLAPDQQGTQQGTAATAEGKIGVITPVLTWKDSKLESGEEANYLNDNLVSADWQYGETPAKDLPEGSIVDTRSQVPGMLLEYSPEADVFTADTPVKVTVNLENLDATSYTTFKHEDCTFEGCKWGTAPEFQNPACQFIVHISTFDLTIVKEVNGYFGTNAEDTFVFHITGPNGYSNTVTLKDGEELTIKGLPVGEYDVAEDMDWAWTYDCINPLMVARKAVYHIGAANIREGKATARFLNQKRFSRPVNNAASVDNRWITVPVGE